MTDLPLLSLLLWSLPVTAALIALAPARRARGLALAGAGIGLALSLLALAAFAPAQAGFQLVEEAVWMPALGVAWRVGVDGLSVLFLPAAQLLFLAVLLARRAVERPRLYYSLLALLQMATLGVFCALDGVLFFLFWELTLVPLYFLLGLWGLGPRSRQAALQYVLTMLAGGAPLLIALAMAGLHHGSFDLSIWLAAPLPAALQLAVFLLLLAGFGVKVPFVPLHSWLPTAAMEGPAVALALITGVKLGAFGLLRLAVPLAPAAAQDLHWLLAGLGTVGVLYGAVAALAQTNLRSMLAYSSLSHVGFVVLGLASLNLAGIQGALLQLLNFTLAAGGLFLLAGSLHQRTGSTELAALGGAARPLPWLASGFLFFGLAGMGFPGTSGFPAELAILLSAFQTHAGAAVAALAGGVVGAAYFFGAYRRAFFGPTLRPELLQAEDLKPRELAVVLVFAALVLAVGIYPDLVLAPTRPALEAWLAGLGR